MFKVLYLLHNYFTHDNRVLRAARTTLEMGGQPIVFARHKDGLAETENIQEIQVKRFHLVTASWPKRKLVQLIKYIEMITRMIWAGYQLHPDLIHANDLYTLPLGYVIARAVGARLIYDSHELFSGTSQWDQFPAWLVRMNLAIERIFSHQADTVITVCDSVADEMARNIGIDRPEVVRNLPEYRPTSPTLGNKVGPLRRHFQIPPDIPIILNQGSIDPGRGIMVLVKAMQQIRHPTAIMVFLGDGPLLPDLKAVVSSAGLQERVYFHPPVSPAELPAWTRDATLGVSPIEGKFESYRLSLPNKLFEYIHAGLPVLATDLPEMGWIVTQYGVGDLFPDGDADSLTNKIDEILSNSDLYQRYRDASIKASSELSWTNEKKRLIAIYRRLLN
jgi:glycosyltransferase involved in cell wall biosynthesis